MNKTLQFPKWLIPAFLILIALIVISVVLRSFWYFEVIENDEVGVKIEAGQITGVAQPGIAYDFGLFVQLIKIKTSAVAILVEDRDPSFGRQELAEQLLERLLPESQ